jgi:nicotinamide riboside transporter PnuC
MDNRSPVEIADRLSRKRAILTAGTAVAFVVAQLLATRPHTGQHALWTFWSLLLLVLLATGGGLLHQTKIRALMNDEVSRDHHRTAVGAGFWTAMVAALAFYWVPGVDTHPARAAIQLIVTIGLAAALLVFAYLELRAHRDA